jgi:hypothetical protein
VRPEHCGNVVVTERKWGELWHLDGARRMRRNLPNAGDDRLLVHRLGLRAYRDVPRGRAPDVPRSAARPLRRRHSLNRWAGEGCRIERCADEGPGMWRAPSHLLAPEPSRCDGRPPSQSISVFTVVVLLPITASPCQRERVPPPAGSPYPVDKGWTARGAPTTAVASDAHHTDRREFQPSRLGRAGTGGTRSPQVSRGPPPRHSTSGGRRSTPAAARRQCLPNWSAPPLRRGENRREQPGPHQPLSDEVGERPIDRLAGGAVQR